MKATQLTIGQLAQRCGVAPHVLRHWEAAGLLTPARQRGERRYTEADVRKVSLIQLARGFGIGLAELRTMDAAFDSGEHETVLRQARAQVEEEIARAQLKLAFLDRALACPHPDYRTCPDVTAMLDAWSADELEAWAKSERPASA